MSKAFPERSDAMHFGQQSAVPGGVLWPLAQGGARRLTIGPGPRWLLVERGRVWLTTTGGGAAMEQDRWLSAGEGVDLPSGAEVVLEAWGGEARFELLVPPQACAGPGGAWAGLGRWLQRLAASARRASLPPRAYPAA